MITVFLFPGNLRTNDVSSLAVPVSPIGVFSVMRALGFSLNMVAMQALVLAMAIVVDDTIVVVETELEHHPATTTAEVSKLAMGEITPPIVAITLSDMCNALQAKLGGC